MLISVPEGMFECVAIKYDPSEKRMYALIGRREYSFDLASDMEWDTLRSQMYQNGKVEMIHPDTEQAGGKYIC